MVIYREPGAGAIAFARTFIKGLSREKALPVIENLLRGELHDKRVKRCDYCGYWWRDVSLRNTKRTCCEDCKRSLKALQRRQQRADKELLHPKPRKRTLMDDYVWWVEYPYWINEYPMIKTGWKYEKPYGIDVMDYLQSQTSIYGEGNRRKATEHLKI